MRSRRAGWRRGSLVPVLVRFAQNRRPVMAKKDQQLTVRVSPEEKREIERRAEAAGLSVSRYLAESGLSDEENRMSSDEREALLEELRQLFREVRSIGGHTNQIAKRLNQRKAVGKKAIERASKAIEQASDAIIGKMEEVL